MGIQSTRDITRQEAIDRILKIDSLLEEKDYRGMARHTLENDHCLQEFVDECGGYGHFDGYLDKWTDRMIEDKMDQPFFRHSMFDNYLVGWE